MEVGEVRAWIQLALAVVGGVVALVVFLQNVKQRRVENALRFVSNFRSALEDEDIAHWKNLFWMSSEIAGCAPGEYIRDVGGTSSLTDYFSEGAPDGYAISRMAESLNVLCHQILIDGADPRTAYYEVGQLLDSMHGWVDSITMSDGKSLESDSFPHIGRFYEKFGKRTESWPSRRYAYVE